MELSAHVPSLARLETAGSPRGSDQRLLRRFIEGHGIYPSGSRVRLSTGDLVLVRAPSGRIERRGLAFEDSAEGRDLAARYADGRIHVDDLVEAAA